jgi:hypothetical protein
LKSEQQRLTNARGRRKMRTGERKYLREREREREKASVMSAQFGVECPRDRME